MILIGLFGGSPESREEITAVVMRAAGAQMAVYNLGDAQGAAGRSRLDRLAIALRGAGAKVKADGLLIPHVLSLDEAQAIRARGGHLWHVMGEPSEVIPIQPQDLHVTSFAGGCRHYLDALEAYSETLLRVGRVR